MVPAGEPTRATIDSWASCSRPGDVVVDGGNSHYVDDQKHGARAGRPRASGSSTCGVSGGVWGLENGYALMVGGDDEP